MKASLSISMDNAAFNEYEPGTELARILRELSDKIELNGCFGPLKLALRDSNGNTVGSFKVIGKPNA